jgi:hypothetical protein
MRLGITTLYEFRVLFIVTQNVNMLSVVMLSVIRLSVVRLRVVMLSVVAVPGNVEFDANFRTLILGRVTKTKQVL